MAKKLTRKFIIEEVKRMDPVLTETDEAFTAAVVLLSSIAVGPNIKRLAKFTQYPRKVIKPFSENLRRNGVWVGGRIYADDWGDEETGGVAFWMDVSVALGFIERVSADESKT
jgi:hypothetical protein